MLMTSQPAERYHADSARVENRGPWMTTTVPDECTVTPSAGDPAISTTDRSSGQYGSAKDTCPTTGPSKNVSGRPHVRSTSWSTTTKSPGWIDGCNEPAAHGPMILVTPSS